MDGLIIGLLILVIIALSLALKFYDPVCKFWATIRQRPYLRIVIRNTKEGEDGIAQIDADYNPQFMWDLDRYYGKLGKGIDYDATMPDNAKIAIFMDDVTADVAEQYRPDMPPEFSDGLDDQVPPMFLNGGQEVKQVVDIAGIKDKTNVTVETG